MFILTAFNMLILILLIVYVFYRLLKTKNAITLVSFTLQLSALTIVLLSLINHVQTSNNVELFYITVGIVCPCIFVAFDYCSMIKKVKNKGSFEGFITVDKNVKGKTDNSVEIMSVISNEAFINETISEFGLLKDDLFKGIKKKLIQAEACYNEHNYDAAYNIYNSLIGFVNTSSNLYFNYGNICFKKGQLNEAISHYRKVLELNEQLIENIKKSGSSHNASNSAAIHNIKFKEYLVYYNIGVTYLHIGKLDFALDNFKKSLEINTSCNNAKEGIGRILTLNGRKLEAVKYYEEILEKDESNYVICLLLGKLLAELGSTAKAQECFEKCIKIGSNEPNVYIELGKLLMSQKQYSEAIKLYKTYIGIKEDDYNGHYSLAGCYYQTKEFSKAIPEYELAVSLNPNSYSSIFNLGIIYEDLQEYDKAINCYNGVIAMNPEFVDAYNNLGILYSKYQRQVEALATYTKGIRVSPNNFRLYYNMGVVLFDLRRYEDAADAFSKASEINPEDSDVYYYLGASLTELKRYEDAISAYKKAFNENISEGEIYYNIAAVYALMKKQDIALDNLKKAISKDSGIKQEVCKNSVFDYMWGNSDFMVLVS